jgi:hypothetical protein
VLEVPEENESSQADSMDMMEMEKALKEWGEEEVTNKPASAEELAAIPEASPGLSSARRNKHRADSADEDVGIVEERRKALRNDGNPEGLDLFTSVNDSFLIENLNDIGISLGVDEASIADSLNKIKVHAASRVQDHVMPSLKDTVLEREEQELAEEELEKLFLRNICSDIMDEVMDQGGDCDLVPPSGLIGPVVTGKGRNPVGVKGRKMRGIFWNCNGFKDPKKYRFVSGLTREQNLCFIAISEMGRNSFSDAVLRNLCGGRNFLWHYKEPRGRSGGILLGIDLDTFDIGEIDEGDSYVKFHLCNKEDGLKWALVAIYDPAQANFKKQFLTEMVHLCSHEELPILLGEDFNMPRNPSEKNKDNFEHHWPFLFNSLIDGLNLRELELSGRKFT